MAPPADGRLVDRVIEASGLAPVIAGGVIRRACQRAGLAESHLTRADVTALLPHIEPLLRVYLGSGEVDGCIAALKKLAG